MGTKFDKERINRILIRSTNWIGDAIMTTPTVRAIRKNFPEAFISLLAKPWVAPVFKNNPYIDNILIYDEADKHRGNLGKLRLSKDLKKNSFDLAILLQNAFEAALITFWARIPIRIGFNRDARRLLLTHPVPCTNEIKKVHQTKYYLGILEGVELKTDGTELDLNIKTEEDIEAENILKQYGINSYDKIIGINPGATYGTAKRWFYERYAEVSKRLIDSFGVWVLVFGSPKEIDLGEQICRSVGNRSINLCGKTDLSNAIAIINRCNLFITNDSGLMHIAAALNIPQIAIFGSTDHITTAPASTKSQIIKIETPCSPCLKPDCPKEHHKCMKNITTDMVYDSAKIKLTFYNIKT
ncbi:MAG: lipopolysaccharide heptosyltransferase II [Desulfobacterales bacterium]|nr:lipopolysaccharide heptosyltransferase II [Desulfobacterales bacterium]MBF0396552.1 lipopolysaccharide heptosyltransferase II [Desulfobacterales bacterium]